VIEILLEAERALSVGLVDRAEHLYRQAVEADPRNSIAMVGLARVALERADDDGALRLGRQALGIDPENDAARRLVARLEEISAHRGERNAPTGTPGSAGTAAPPPTPPPPVPRRRRGVLRRIFGRG
jgi:thioredoxin-like negative regulator of GroEL